jgi:hypothetical protein
MNSPEVVVSPKASRWVPGVKVPVAAPNWALDLTSRPSWLSVRPWAAGNWLARGRSAAGSSATAAGSAVVDDVWVLLVAVAEAELELDSELDEPQPARPTVRAAAAPRTDAWRTLMDSIMARANPRWRSTSADAAQRRRLTSGVRPIIPATCV